MRVKTNGKRSAWELANGQVWRLKNAYIHIVELGKRLIHYRVMESLAQKGVRTQISGIEVMRRYLRTQRARLVPSPASR